jgi:hypothetical protein
MTEPAAGQPRDTDDAATDELDELDAEVVEDLDVGEDAEDVGGGTASAACWTTMTPSIVNPTDCVQK